MWLYHCIFILFPYIVNCLKDNEHVQSQNDDPELVFTDVIKNISRVNNVLQELINNYEQLKNMYKSQENSETGESDTEIDEVFKAKERSGTTKKVQPNQGEFPATQMFLSDGEGNSKSASVENEDKSNKNDAPVKDVTEKAEEYSMSDLSTAEWTDTSSEKEEDNHKTKKVKTALRQKSEIVFIDTHTTTTNTVVHKPKMMRSNLITINKVFDPQTINVEENTTNNTRNVQKVVYAELFSKKNIWNEILKNKPIRLQRSQIDYSTLKPGNRSKRVHLRSAGSIPNGVQDTNDNKNIKDNQQTNKDTSFDQTEDEIVIKKEQFKTDVLRTAYGDACLKLVVTKCNRACTAAGKSVCRSHSCKSNFKNKYTSSARKGCRKEFWGEEPDAAGDDDGTGSTKQLYHYRGATTDTQATENSAFVDLTRGGYLSAACLPGGQNIVEPQKHESLGNETAVPLTNPDVVLNILRDKYEDACKKISAGKCRKACSFAYGTACQGKGNCNKDKKKAFKKACRSECKTAYKLSRDDSASDYYDEPDNDKSDKDNSSDE